MTALRDTVRKGWPALKFGLSECLYPYFDIRDELTIQDNLIFKGQQLVIPAAMRREMMSLTHASHMVLRVASEEHVKQCSGPVWHLN